MARLKAAERNALPGSEFAGPDRSYPIPDATHAANAKARATQAVKAGRMSEGEKERIDAKANRKLAHTRKPGEPAHHQHGRRHAHSTI